MSIFTYIIFVSYCLSIIFVIFLYRSKILYGIKAKIKRDEVKIRNIVMEETEIINKKQDEKIKNIVKQEIGFFYLKLIPNSYKYVEEFQEGKKGIINPNRIDIYSLLRHIFSNFYLINQDILKSLEIESRNYKEKDILHDFKEIKIFPYGGALKQ